HPAGEGPGVQRAVHRPPHHVQWGDRDHCQRVALGSRAGWAPGLPCMCPGVLPRIPPHKERAPWWELDVGTPSRGHWATGGGGVGTVDAVTNGSTTAATAGSATPWYDNGNTAGATQPYVLSQSHGFNCALSFRF